MIQYGKKNLIHNNLHTYQQSKIIKFQNMICKTINYLSDFSIVIYDINTNF